VSGALRGLALAICLLAGCDFRGIRPEFALTGAMPLTSDVKGEFTSALFQTTGARMLAGHRWVLVENGSVFAAIMSDIGQAQRSINFSEYIWEPGEASDRMVQALAARPANVQCRVLVDALGSPAFAKQVAPRLREIGCEARVFRPLLVRNLLERNHRKLVVIDGRIAYLGGFGVRDEWRSKRRRFFGRAHRRFANEWRDDNIRLSGPVVNDVQRAFAQNWQEAGGALLPQEDLPIIAPQGDARVAFVSSSAGYVTDSERLVHLLIGAARRRVYIANAYFVPDESLLRLLMEKARQGVEVRVIAPGVKNDLPLVEIGQRQMYKELLGAGVHVYEYQPAMMHSKTMLIDDRLAMIGSLNLNLLSMSRLEEAVFVIDDPKLVQALDLSWLADLTDSREVKLRN
jgi:cardiolipin synthase